jgi:hypothetical protein
MDRIMLCRVDDDCSIFDLLTDEDEGKNGLVGVMVGDVYLNASPSPRYRRMVKYLVVLLLVVRRMKEECKREQGSRAMTHPLPPPPLCTRPITTNSRIYGDSERIERLFGNKAVRFIIYVVEEGRDVLRCLLRSMYPRRRHRRSWSD